MNSQEQILQDQQKLEGVVSDALQIAQELGADTAEISISKQRRSVVVLRQRWRSPAIRRLIRVLGWLSAI
jgi:hypothetical protein